MTGAVLEQRLRDLRPGAVPGAEEQDERRSAVARRDGGGRGGGEPDARVKGGSGGAEQVAAAEQIDPVVDVAAIRRAASGADETRIAELGQVIRDQVLRLAQPFGELTNPAIAVGQLTEQLPALWVGDQLQELMRRAIDRGDAHAGDITSIWIDVISTAQFRASVDMNAARDR